MINTFTSLLAGLVIFATLGYMAFTSGVNIHDVAEAGPGLAFVVYPKAIGMMPWSPVWSVCFFAMILLLGIDSQVSSEIPHCAITAVYLSFEIISTNSPPLPPFPIQFAGVEGIITAITDFHPQLVVRPWKRMAFVGIVCFVSCILGFPMVMNVSCQSHGAND